MKVLSAAVAAVVVVGSVFSGVSAFADEGAPPAAPPVSSVAIGQAANDGFDALALPTPSTSSSSVTRQAAPDAAPADATSASVTGLVTYKSGVAAGAEVYAVRLNPTTLKTISTTDTLTKADGTFAFTGLVAGTYVFSFFYDAGTDGETAMWWNATGGSPKGSGPVVIAAGQTIVVNQLLVQTATVQGTVLTGNEALPLKPSVVDVEVGVFNGRVDPNGDKYYSFFYAPADLKADGTYTVGFILPFGDLVLFGNYTGTDSFVSQSYGEQFGLGAGANPNQNLTITRLIDPVAGVDDPTNRVLNALYWDFLDRQPGASEVTFWNGQFENGAGLGDVSAGFVNSDEYRLIRIDAAYQNILGRTPDAKGRADWLKWMQQGSITTDDIETSLYSSDEFYLQSGNTNTGFMTAIYSDLLHRTGSQSEYDFWSNLIVQHGRAWVVNQFWSSTETIRERVTLMYEKYLGRTPDAAGLDHWVDQALQLGDSGLRSALTGNQEYFNRAYYPRFSE